SECDVAPNGFTLKLVDVELHEGLQLSGRCAVERGAEYIVAGDEEPVSELPGRSHGVERGFCSSFRWIRRVSEGGEEGQSRPLPSLLDVSERGNRIGPQHDRLKDAAGSEGDGLLRPARHTLVRRDDEHAGLALELGSE